MREEFEKLAAAGKIQRTHIETLVVLAESGYCTHKSWGFGRIKSVDTVFARFTIDFQTKAGHSMDLGFAADSLKAIPAAHILARKASDIEGLRQMAALHHLDVIKLVLESLGGKASLDQIQQVLVPDVIRDDWKKWWEVAKKELIRDGHFTVPTKKSEPITYQAREVALGERLLSEFRAAKGLKAKTATACEALKSFPDLPEADNVARELVAGLNADIATHQRTQPAVALEAIFTRDELAQAAGLPAGPADVTSAVIWAQDVRLGTILEAMPAPKQKKALQSFKEAHPHAWSEPMLIAMNSSSTKVAGEIAAILIQENKLDLLKETLARLISRHTASSELLLWLAKERSDAFADILGPEVFRAMLTAIDRDQFNEKKSNRLHDYILDDQQLLVELIGSADFEVIKDLTRSLQLSPCFDDMDKRSLLARIVKSYPAVQSLISGDQAKQDNTLLVSWASLEKRKNEYTDLVQKKIPANSREIAIARSYGDLRENHEYKAAKEMQKILMRRKGELEAQLVRARGTDFANSRTDVVSVGNHVHLTDLGTQSVEQYTILGAWDTEPEKGIVSYLTPLAQALIGKKIGEETEFDMDGTKKRYRVDSIEAVQAAPAAVEPENEPEPARADMRPTQPEPTA
jgi:transcription elongation GreA/GreB family factor